VSIVVPALDEAATVEEVLKGLTALDFEEYGLGKEILLVDGGSTDGTPGKARAVRGVRVFSSPRKGRGAALRLGIAQARGDIVVFFPSDNEYRPRDVEAVVGAIARQGFKAVYGTRAIKCADLDGRLKRIYGGSALLYRMSKYGGMLLSALMLVFFNRYITDTLTTLKGFDGRLLRSLDLTGDGLDLEMEILAKISRRHEYVLEVPVEYRPRTRAEGKKTTVFDGLHAAAALLKYRWAR
jgi:glycosyltransferase involved in cell wall biosynthesis